MCNDKKRTYMQLIPLLCNTMAYIECKGEEWHYFHYFSLQT